MNSTAAEEPKKGLFSHEKKKDTSQDVLAEVNMVGRRLRVMEEQYNNLRRKIQVTDQNMLSYNKKNITEIRTVNMEMSELRRTIEDIQNNILLIIKELRLCAKKEEVNVLQKYINMWEPVNFVTRQEVERIVEEALHRREQ